MIFHGSEFYVLNRDDICEDELAMVIDNMVDEYKDKLFKYQFGYLANLDVRWCIFYTEDKKIKYFYCFTVVEFLNSRMLNTFKLLNSELYEQIKTNGFKIRVSDIERRAFNHED